MKLASIVEGHGEVKALRALVEATLAQTRPGTTVEVLTPYRVKRQKVVQPNELERDVDFLAGRVGDTGAILIILDSDGDCAATAGPELLRRARVARPDRRIGVVFAVHEFEAWFLASLQSLRGHRGIPADAPVPPSPDEIPSPKGRIDTLMGGMYQETIDQPALCSRIDVAVARERSPSFDKFVRELTALLP
jgi:hypothetical protein